MNRQSIGDRETYQALSLDRRIAELTRNFAPGKGLGWHFKEEEKQ